MKYEANPVIVDAYKIQNVDAPQPNGDVSLLLEGASRCIATPEMTARYMPKIGDYWVVQSDGYSYLNPKDVFERKYRRHYPVCDTKEAVA